MSLDSFYFTQNDFELEGPWLGQHFQGRARAPGGTSRQFKPEIYPAKIPNTSRIESVKFNEIPSEEGPSDDEYIP